MNTEISRPAATRLDSRGKRRKTARELWTEASRNERPPQGNDLIHIDGGGIKIGPRIIVRAVMDIADAPLELSWQSGGLSENFVRKGIGDLNEIRIRHFLECMNTVMETNRRRERFPADLFKQTFRHVEEIERACAANDEVAQSVHLPFGLPDMDGMVGGPSLDLVDNIQAELTTFAQASRHGLFLLHGSSGDGKKTAFALMLKEVFADNLLTVYISGRDDPSYLQIIQNLFFGIVPASARKEKAQLSEMLGQIQQTLLSRPLVIVINGFDAFEEQTEGETVVRDELLFLIFDVLMSPHGESTRLFVGTTATLNSHRPHPLKSWASERSIEFKEAQLPSLRPEHGAKLIGRNSFAPAPAVPAYIHFARRHFSDESNLPTLFTVTLAALFAFSGRVAPDNRTELLSDATLRRAVDAVRLRDLKALIELAVEELSPDLRLALLLICLSEDGLRSSSLRQLLRDADFQGGIAALVTKVEQGGLGPLIQRGSYKTPHNQTEAHFDTHHTFRHLIIRISEGAADGLRKVRVYHAAIARLALARHRQQPQQSMDRTATYRRPMQYFRHELASLDPQELRASRLLERLPEVEKDAYGLIENLIQQGKATPAQRFCYALWFFEREIRGCNEAGLPSTHAGDAVELRLLLAALHVGHFLAPMTSTLTSTPMLVPPIAPFSSERLTFLDVLRNGGLQPPPAGEGNLNQLIESMKIAVAQIHCGPMPRDSSGVLSVFQQVFERVSPAVWSACRHSDREICDSWARWMFTELARIAIRVDIDSVFLSANPAAEHLANAARNAETRYQCGYNSLNWNLRRGSLATGEEAARKWSDEVAEALLSDARALRNPSDPASAVRKYRNSLRWFHKFAGRRADFAAARGALRPALDRYTQLAESDSGMPRCLQRQCADLTEIVSALHMPPEHLAGPSARNMVRLSWHLFQRQKRIFPADGAQQRATSNLLVTDRTEFEPAAMASMVELARRVLHRETDRAEQQRYSEDAMAVALERAAMYRFNDLQYENAGSDWMGAAGKQLQIARQAALSGNASVLRGLRLISEEARYAWHRAVFHGPAPDDDTEESIIAASSSLSSALNLLGRIISVAKVRNVRLYLVDALLLRAEIMGCCQLALNGVTQKTPPAIISPGVAIAIEKKYRRQISPTEDLRLASRLIDETGFRKRVTELLTLQREQGSTPCAYLVT